MDEMLLITAKIRNIKSRMRYYQKKIQTCEDDTKIATINMKLEELNNELEIYKGERQKLRDDVLIQKTHKKVKPIEITQELLSTDVTTVESHQSSD